jgi:YXWGXW repeat-containing protein
MNTFTTPVSWLTKAAALAAALLLPAIPLTSPAQVYVGFNLGVPPPPLPMEYSQPLLTTPGQVWQPGYWAWGPAGYYWVPGTYVTPPSTGMYWTPGYWGYNNGSYDWNNGYWAPQVGYYGGIDYGFGYPGVGYTGGYWNNGAFMYNTAVTNVDRRFVTHVYTRNVIVHRNGVRYAFNGPGGVRVRPTARELAVVRERHIAPTTLQVEHARIAGQDRNLYVVNNHGHPQVVAVSHPIRTTRALPHYSAVTAADRRAADREVRTRSRAHAAAARTRAETAAAHGHTVRAARDQAQAARAHAEAARAHAQAARIHNAQVHTQASRARAQEARAREKAATARAHAATAHAHAVREHKRPPNG